MGAGGGPHSRLGRGERPAHIEAHREKWDEGETAPPLYPPGAKKAEAPLLRHLEEFRVRRGPFLWRKRALRWSREGTALTGLPLGEGVWISPIGPREVTHICRCFAIWRSSSRALVRTRARALVRRGREEGPSLWVGEGPAPSPTAKPPRGTRGEGPSPPPRCKKAGARLWSSPLFDQSWAFTWGGPSSVKEAPSSHVQGVAGAWRLPQDCGASPSGGRPLQRAPCFSRGRGGGRRGKVPRL